MRSVSSPSFCLIDKRSGALSTGMMPTSVPNKIPAADIAIILVLVCRCREDPLSRKYEKKLQYSLYNFMVSNMRRCGIWSIRVSPKYTWNKSDWHSLLWVKRTSWTQYEFINLKRFQTKLSTYRHARIRSCLYHKRMWHRMIQIPCFDYWYHGAENGIFRAN